MPQKKPVGRLPPEAIRRTELPRLPADILAGFAALIDLTGTVSDALDQLGIVGVVPAYLLPPVTAGGRIVGPALTVRNVAHTTQIHKAALDSASGQGETEAHNLAEPGDVLVIQGVMGCSNMGGQSATIARRQGFAGAIVDGTVRDPDQYRGMGWPMWCKGFTPITGKWRMQTVEVNGVVEICGVQVRPGDLVCADDAGIAFVPHDQAAAVLAIAARNRRRRHETQGRHRPGRLRRRSRAEKIQMMPANLVFILSDEHNKRVTGCYGHPMIKTPNLDALAARGTRFTAAYTNCPICVPARASFATGQYVHKIRFWDNAIAYDGTVPSWGHRLMAQGHHVASIGKLHYLDSDAKRNGFDEEILPLHIVNGMGDLLGLIRDELPRRPGSAKLGPEAGRGESEYTEYDRDIAAATVKWLEQEAPKHRDKPWALYVGFVSPHFPLIAPPQFYDMYPESAVPWPLMYDPAERPRHPFIDAMRKCLCYDDAFDVPMVRRAITAYFGLTSFLDDNVGTILRALEDTGLMENTRVVYSSDHGDNLGTRGMWGKSTMYEESAGIPMIMAGPDVPKGNVCDHAGDPRRRLPDVHRRRGCETASRRRRAARHLVDRHRAGARAQAHDPLRVPRGRRRSPAPT